MQVSKLCLFYPLLFFLLSFGGLVKYAISGEFQNVIVQTGDSADAIEKRIANLCVEQPTEAGLKRAHIVYESTLIEQMAAIIHKNNPKTRIYYTNQKFDNNEFKKMFCRKLLENVRRNKKYFEKMWKQARKL